MTQHVSPSSTTASSVADWSIALIRLVGYGLLLLSLFDLVVMLIPLELMNPTWELQRFGELIERVAVPLVALALIFYRAGTQRNLLEQFLLKGLSWFCLAFGVLLLILTPIALINIQRVDVQNEVQLSSQYDQQLRQLEQLELQVNQASLAEINDLATNQGVTVTGNLPQIKEKLQTKVALAKQELAAQYNQNRANQHLTLVKNGIKWCLGALVSGTLFIYMWRLTKVVRLGKDLSS